MREAWRRVFTCAYSLGSFTSDLRKPFCFLETGASDLRFPAATNAASAA